jgi:hypothetical protein
MEAYVKYRLENEIEDTGLRIPVFGFPVPHETYATNSPDYGASFSSYQMQESWIYSYFLKLPNFVDMDSLCITKSRVKF